MARDVTRPFSPQAATLALLVMSLTAHATAQAVEAPSTPYGSAAAPAAAQSSAQVPGASAAAPNATPVAAPTGAHPESIIDLNVQRLRLNGRIVEAELARKRQRIAGPLTLVLTSFTVGTFCAMVAIGSGSAVGRIKSDARDGTYHKVHDYNDDGSVDHSDVVSARRLSLGYAGTAILSLAAGGLGVWWFTRRTQVRSRIDRELRGLQVERNVLELKLDGHVSSTGASADVGFSF